jgi:GrpB-like predicted nucleotidyltransferase (UPF0157 family)
VSEQPLRSDEDIAAARIGPPDVLDGQVALEDYQPGWPGLFAREEVRIRAVLGARALRLEHVGSTSVPGLAAKPRIDVLLVVGSTADEPGYVPALEGAGYTLRIREPDWHEHRVLGGPDTAVNLHVFPRGCLEVERMLLFRDHLRRDAEDRERYARTKRALAGRTWKYTQHYADAKSEVVEAILARAGAAPRAGDLCPGDR